MLQERFGELGRLLLDQTASFYGQRLISVAVLGSVARETQDFHSDIDVLIISKELPNGRIGRIREFEAVKDRREPFLRSPAKDVFSPTSPSKKNPEPPALESLDPFSHKNCIIS